VYVTNAAVEPRFTHSVPHRLEPLERTWSRPGDSSAIGVKSPRYWMFVLSECSIVATTAAVSFGQPYQSESHTHISISIREGMPALTGLLTVGSRTMLV